MDFLAIREQRQRYNSDRAADSEVDPTYIAFNMLADRILEVDRLTAQSHLLKVIPFNNNETKQCHAVELLDWIPHFTELQMEDRSILINSDDSATKLSFILMSSMNGVNYDKVLRIDLTETPLAFQAAKVEGAAVHELKSWNELFLASVAYRSTAEALWLPNGQSLNRFQALRLGIELLFDRIANELTSKLQELETDLTELGCLCSITLYNPDAPGLTCSSLVESFREKLYCKLEDYCLETRPNEPGRFAKLLLRLPALRSISIKCRDSIDLLLPSFSSESSLIHKLQILQCT